MTKSWAAALAAEDDATPKRRRQQSLGALLAQQASAPELVYSPLAGGAKIGQGILAGLMLRKEADDAAAASTAGDAAAARLGAALMGGGRPAAVMPSATASAVAPSTASAASGDRADVATLKAALGPMESGGRYGITGPTHARMGTALGKYQIMSANLPSWSQAALGRTVSPQEFLNSPELQEQIAGHRMGQILDKYGNLQDAASVWHSGRPLAQATAAGARDVNMSTADYVARTVGRSADRPAANARPVSFDAMGNATGGLPITPEGFAIPPAPAPSPQPNPGQLDALAQITGGGQMPTALPPVEVDEPPNSLVPPEAEPSLLAPSAPLVSAPLPVTLPGTGSSPPVGVLTSAPMPPPRPADLGAQPSAPPSASAPLPPARPTGLASPADLPAPGAQEASLPGGVRLGQLLAGPDLSNRDDAGVRDFTRTEGLAQALGGGAGPSPQAVRTAQAMGIGAPPARTATDAAPMQILPSAQAGGPVPGPNGPVTGAPTALPSGMSWADISMLGRSENPVHRMIANKAVERALATRELRHVDLGDSVGFVDEQGNVIRNVPKAQAPTHGVIGQDAYGNLQYGFVDRNARTVTPTGPAGGGQVLPGAPGSTIPAPPPGVDPKIWREQQSKNATAESLPVDPKVAAGLRDEVRSLPSYKNYAQASPIYRSMLDTAGTNSKASDLNLIYGLGKIMDPGSVVREGEMALANNTSGLDERLKGFASSVFGGARLTPETRASLLREAHSRMKSYEDVHDIDRQFYSGIAKRGRVAEEDILPRFERAKPWEPPTPVPTGPPDRAVVEQELRRRGLLK